MVTDNPAMPSLASSKDHRVSKTVGDVMTSKVTFLNAMDKFADAVNLMGKHEFHHCVVVDANSEPIGVLSDRDVFRGLSRGEKWQDKKIGEIMTHSPITVTSDTKLVDALGKMIGRGVHCLPVVRPGRSVIVGILTCTDLLRSFQTSLESLATIEQDAG